MLNEELAAFLEMSYDEMCLALKDKYGPATENYYRNSDSKSRNRKVSRTKEGLFCHHIGELEAAFLAELSSLEVYPYEYQKAENLVYCNYFEHLILHLKLNIIDSKAMNFEALYTRPGLWWIAGAINNLYRTQMPQKEWERECYELIKDRKQEYFLILRGLLALIEKHVKGDDKRKKEIIGFCIKSASAFYENVLWDELRQELEKPLTDEDLVIGEKIYVGAKKDWETLYTRKRIVEGAIIYSYKKKMMDFRDRVNSEGNPETKVQSFAEKDSNVSELSTNAESNDSEESDEMQQRVLLLSVVIIVILIILVVYYAV